VWHVAAKRMDKLGDKESCLMDQQENRDKIFVGLRTQKTQSFACQIN
jgi:hypothetical protein